MRQQILIFGTLTAVRLSGTQISAAPRYSDWSAAGGVGLADLYMSTRTKAHGAP